MWYAYQFKVCVLHGVVRKTFLRVFSKFQKLFSNVKTKFHANSQFLDICHFMWSQTPQSALNPNTLKHQLHKKSAFSYSNTNHTNSCKINTVLSSSAHLPFMRLVLHAAGSETFVLLLVLKENKPYKTDNFQFHCFTVQFHSLSLFVPTNALSSM
jgi:hypothetical protein